MKLAALADLLPGLYLLALVEVLAFALRRGFDPLPPRQRVAFFAALLLLLGPVLCDGGILLPLDNLRTAIPFRQLAPTEPAGHGLQGDLVHQIAPWLHLVRATTATGGWPLWNQLSGAGMPLLADPQTQVLQPLVLATLPLPLWSSLGVLAALRIWMALAFTFLLLRRQGLAEAAACFGAFAYGCGGFLLLWLGWPIANVGALLPAALYAALLCADRGWRRDRILLALTVAALLLGGHPETMLYALGLTALFLFDRLRRAPSEAGGPAIWRRLAHCATPFAVAAGLAAPILLPTLEFLPSTSRAAILDYRLSEPQGSAGESPWREAAALTAWRDRATQRLAAIVAPRAFGTLDFYWGNVNAIEDGSGFAGGAATLLALLTLLPWRGAKRAPQERLVAAVLAASLFLIVQPEGFDRLLARIPGMRATVAHQNHRILILISFSLAYLAACELDRWLRGARQPRSAAGVALALGGAIALAFGLWPPDARLNLGFDFQWRALLAQLGAVALAALLLLLPARRLRPAHASWGLVALVAVELLATYRSANPPAPQRLAYPLAAPLRYLIAHAGNDRIAGIGASAFSANFPLVYGLRDVRINNPALPRAYESATVPIRRFTATGSASFVRPNHPLYDLLGVRYVIARPEVPVSLPVVYCRADACIYERPQALARLFLPTHAKPHRAGSWIDFLARNPDFSTRALVATEAPQGRERVWKASDPAASRLVLGREEATHLGARAWLVERRLLASGILQDGNWRILANGVPRPGVLTNGAFVGAWLPAGELRVELLYRPAYWCFGCLLCALALVSAATLWIPPPGRMVFCRPDGSPGP